jgi:hypothetical protein
MRPSREKGANPVMIDFVNIVDVLVEPEDDIFYHRFN